MAVILQTPSILSITPFDPSKDHNIEFLYQGNQCVKSRAVIMDSSTSKTIYDKTQQGMRLYHTIPANTLTAGKKYTIKIQVFDENDNSSNLSSPVLFLCLTKPSFSFEEISNGVTHKESLMTLHISYSQSENEPIKNYQFIQYNASKIEIESSDISYDTEDMSYTFYGLENNTTYYFRAVGETKNGISLDTGYIEINAVFDLSPIDAVMQLENDYNNGVVRVIFNIRDVDFEIGSDSYSYEDGMIVLDDNYLKYFDGIELSGNFSLFLQINRTKVGTFLDIHEGFLTVSAIQIADTYFYALKVQDSDFGQYIKLNNPYINGGYIYPSSKNSYSTLVIKRKNGFLSMELL